MRRYLPLWELTLLRLRVIYRETGAMFWTFGFPLALSVVLGLAFRDQPKATVGAAIELAANATPAQRAQAEALQKALAASPEVRAAVQEPAEARQALRVGKVLVIVQPAPAADATASPGVAESAPGRGRSGPARTYVFDPLRPESRLARSIVDDALQRAEGRKDTALVADHPVVEPGSRYIDFLIPGLIGSNIMSSGLWGVGYTLGEMRNKRLIKRLVATPMSRGHFLASFVLMRMIFLALELLVLLSFGALVFHVPVRGSLSLVVLLSVLGSLTFSGLGLLVASRAQNLPTINGLINLVIMPMFLGSGVFFATSRFPGWLQPALKALPLTALNDGLRAVMLDGYGLRGVVGQIALLAGFAVVSFAVALKIFRWR